MLCQIALRRASGHVPKSAERASGTSITAPSRQMVPLRSLHCGEHTSWPAYYLELPIEESLIAKGIDPTKVVATDLVAAGSSGLVQSYLPPGSELPSYDRRVPVTAIVGVLLAMFSLALGYCGLGLLGRNTISVLDHACEMIAACPTVFSRASRTLFAQCAKKWGTRHQAERAPQASGQLREALLPSCQLCGLGSITLPAPGRPWPGRR